MAAKLAIAVVGVGHLGKEHARVLSSMDGVELAGVCDIDIERARKIADSCGTKAYSDFKALPAIDAVSIAVPTVLHHELARHFLERGVHVFVEKPMTKTIAQAKELVQLARAKKRKLQVGHIERFNPALVGAQPYIKDPLYIESYRISPFSFRSSDIGVVMDLMIHDLDIILHLVDSPIAHVDAVGISVLADAEDVANARIEFENGCVATLTVSRVSLKRERKVRGFFGDCYISLDYDKKQGVVYRKNPEFAAGKIKISDIKVASPAEIATLAFDKFLQVHELTMDAFEPLQRELLSFVDCIRNDREPLVTGEHGLRAMQAAEAVLERIRAHRDKVQALHRGS